VIEIIFHGRGGQGAVTSAEMLALAAIGEGKYAQAFPNFGPERRGAPVVAFARIDTKPIRLRTKIYNARRGGCAGPKPPCYCQPRKRAQGGGILIINSQ